MSPIEYRPLGQTGVKVSSLCMGTMTFGKEADEETATAIFQRCREVGINFFDCADVYVQGRSEEILGRLIAPCRNDVVIASKVNGVTGPGVNDRGLSRRHIMLGVEQSLKRLGTDRIDLYYLHAFDPATTIDEVLRSLDDLVTQGKILYPAVSNWSAWQIAKALGVSHYSGLARFACIQPMYNLVKRQAEVEILPLALSEKLAVVSYSPLGGGLLSGKYGATTRPQNGRLVANAMYARRYGDAVYYDVADRFTTYAEAHALHPAALAVAWVMSHPAITAPIIGARNLEQLNGSLAALDIAMTPAWRDEISALSPEPPPPTDRSEQRRPTA
jgi:aryl-alcohol dehydrogenase-like predicted oxidoreductase